jgi:hypothetical protein
MFQNGLVSTVTHYNTRYECRDQLGSNENRLSNASLVDVLVRTFAGSGVKTFMPTFFSSHIAYPRPRGCTTGRLVFTHSVGFHSKDNLRGFSIWRCSGEHVTVSCRVCFDWPWYAARKHTLSSQAAALESHHQNDWTCEASCPDVSQRTTAIVPVLRTAIATSSNSLRNQTPE